MRMLRIKNLIVPILLFWVVFGLYLYTSPRLPTGYADSEEMMAAAYTLGVPHPPGYPLFPILAKPFTFIPFGTIAFRFSIFSSFFGALTIVLVYLTILKILTTGSDEREKTGKVVAASVGALSLAFSYTFWLYSIVPEVFCLSNFFCALLLFILISWYQAEKQEKKEAKYCPYLLVFSGGLAFLSQQVLAFLAPSILYFAWIINKKIFIPSKKWLGLIGAGILGLSPLIYLPLAALREPKLDYGNPTSLSRFWDHITRKVYAEASGGGSAYIPTHFDLGEKIANLPQCFSFLVGQFTPIVAIIALIGLFFIIKNYRAIGSFILLTFIFTGPILAIFLWAGMGEEISSNSLGAQERMTLMSAIVFSIFIGIGIFYLLQLIKKLKFGKIPNLIIILLFLLIIPIYPLRANFQAVNKNNFNLGQDFAENLFLNLEPNAILFVRGDRPTFAAQYYQLVEKKRLDVTVLSFGSRPWDIERWKKREPDLFDTENKALLAVFRDIIQKNIDKRPIYITGLPTENLIQLGIAGNPFVVSPRGIICQVAKDFDFGQGYWDKLIWHGQKNIDAYYDWYAKELIEQYIVGLSNNYFHYRIRNYYGLAQQEFLEMQKIAPEHHLTKKVAADFGEFEKSDKTPKRFVLGQGKDHFEMARSYLQEKKVAEAMSEYWTAIYLEPDNNVYRLQLGGTYEVLGWYQDAYEQYQRILSTEKNNEIVIKKAKERIEVVKYKLGI